MLTKEEIKRIEHLLMTTKNDNGQYYVREGDGFSDFLREINGSVLNWEQKEITEKISYFAQNIAGGESVDVMQEIMGRFQFLMTLASQVAQKGNARGLFRIQVTLQGSLWERNFCREHYFGTTKESYVHLPQKWHHIGASVWARGSNIPRQRISAPDVEFTSNGCLIWGTIKHEMPTPKYFNPPGEGYFSLSESEYRAVNYFLNLHPPVPFWIIIHNAERLGKWKTRNEAMDWLAGDIRKMPNPIPKEHSTKGTARFGENKMITDFFWHKDWFTHLADALSGVSK
jgi:hypothetical protein